MPRKRSNLSFCSNNAKRMRIARSQESEEDREARLKAAREHQAKLRATETSAQRESRLSLLRLKMRASRNLMYKRRERLSANSEPALSHVCDTFADKKTRMSSQKIRRANTRSQETHKNSEAHLKIDHKAHADSRVYENFYVTETRLRSQRARTLQTSEMGSHRGREVQFTADRENQNNKDAEEFFDLLLEIDYKKTYFVQLQDENSSLSERTSETKQ